MTGPVSVAPWEDPQARPPEGSAFHRLWRGFATARVGVAAVLLTLLSALFTLLQPAPNQFWILGFCGVYLAATLAVRLFGAAPRRALGAQWLLTIGVDLVAIATLQLTHAAGINFAPLLAVPVLMGSVLGPRALAVSTVAAVTVLLMIDAGLRSLQPPFDPAQRLMLQEAMTGLGYLALALLVNSLARRLAREERRAIESQEAARIQAQVNELVIENLADGVLVVDAAGLVRAANPTACSLLGRAGTAPGFNLADDPSWLPLMELAQRTIVYQANQLHEVGVGPDGQPQRRMFVRTRLAATGAQGQISLCVLFLEDLREMEARLRIEKLAAMGRMSAAVAHEIRNPLTAIAQANALLDEDLTDPTQRQLSAMVRQNAQRLAQIADEILSVARVQQQGRANSVTLPLDPSVEADCADWARQTASEGRLRVSLQAGRSVVPFESDHLRRVLVNLLDNALRYAGAHADSIQVATSGAASPIGLRVWSDGPALEPGVQRHLFEPFFSSESRSSGLGLYICRELCERHGAQIGYRRGPAPLGAPREGNEFFVDFLAATVRATEALPPATIGAS